MKQTSQNPRETPHPGPPKPGGARGEVRKGGFGHDFRRFFRRGLAALLPTLVTLWLIVWAWGFLWEALGQHLITAVKWIWGWLVLAGAVPQPWGDIDRYFPSSTPGGAAPWWVQLIGVTLAVVLVYTVGLFVGNLIGRTMWRLAEVLVMKVPILRAVYPAVKQITDYLLSDRREQFAGRHVVAVEPHENGIWSIGLVTGSAPPALATRVGEDMVTVFVPSSPTAFSGYMLVVPRSRVVELPLGTEEAMRLLVSGGVLTPQAGGRAVGSGANIVPECGTMIGPSPGGKGT